MSILPQPHKNSLSIKKYQYVIHLIQFIQDLRLWNNKLKSNVLLFQMVLYIVILSVYTVCMQVPVHTHRKKEAQRDLLKNSTGLFDFIADHSIQSSWDPSNTGCSKNQ